MPRKFFSFFTIITTLLLSFSLFAQNIYYVSSSEGNDKNNGLSEQNPFKTIKRVNDLKVMPNTKILFKRGDIWENGTTLNLDFSGKPNERIIIGDYSSGEKPILSLLSDIYPDNAFDPDSWKMYGNNIWMISAYGATSRVFIDGKEYNSANEIDKIDDVFRWRYVIADQKLYLYSTSNPAKVYKSLKRTFSSQNYSVIDLNNSDFVTIQNLDLKYGLYGIKGRGVDSLIIENCNIGMGCDRSAIDIRGNLEDYSSYGIIRSNKIVSGFDKIKHYEYYELTGSNGIVLEEGVTYFEIYENFIKDWYHNNIQILGWDAELRKSSFNKVYNNFLTSPGVSYSRGFTVGGIEKDACAYNEIFSNTIRNIVVPNEIAGNNNLIYYNVIDTVREEYIVTKDGYVNSQTGIAFTLEPLFGPGKGYCENNSLINNTIMNCTRRGLTIYGSSNSLINNFCTSTPMFFVTYSVNNGSEYSNNCFLGDDINSTVIGYDREGFSMTDFNSANENFSDVFQNNFYIRGNTDAVISETSDSAYYIPENSPLINMGKYVADYKDLYNQDIIGAPDVGAIEYTTDLEFEYFYSKINISNVLASSTTNTLTSPLYTIDGKGANDRDVNSRWSSYPTPQWLIYDLEDIFDVDQVRISFYEFNNGRIYNYSIETSADNVSWNTVIKNVNSANTEWTINKFSSQKARYVKIILHSANNSKWATIWETEIYGGQNLEGKAKNDGSNIISDTSFINITDVLASSTTNTLTSPLSTIDGKGYDDGDVNSRWSSYPTPQFLIFKFDSVRTVSKSRISFYKFDQGREYNYSLDYSTDSKTWNSLVEKSVSSNTEFTEDTFDSVNAKYIRLNLLGANNTQWATVWEAEFYGNTKYVKTTDPSLKELIIKNVEASSTSNTLTSPLATIDGKCYNDGDPNSRWSSYPTPQWLIYDLGEIKSMNKVDISFYQFDQGRIYNYSISTSSNKTDWKNQINNASSKNSEWTSNSFDTINARYLRIELHSANNTKWATIWETKIFGYNTNENLLKENISDDETKIKNTSLNQNHPNPFNPITNISFYLNKGSNVKLKIFNVNGEEVANLIDNNWMKEGKHQIRFTPANLASGIYFYRLITDHFHSTKKMIYLK
ncbi:MAG: discoidin domain-containing protein [Melioribacteraceae bacterium]|nr:discoidin domain-containing protein [Melioribacteraceae bacterium]